ncbi:hypothetical protein KCP70_11630 [Salmonella enterica subsp. enterica]|nr:hypothetical protein KCP70_11630 [Salmonella enterica subsp. enterica]
MELFVCRATHFCAPVALLQLLAWLYNVSWSCGFCCLISVARIAASTCISRVTTSTTRSVKKVRPG